MPAQRLLPDDTTLVHLRSRGWSYDDIATEYGVTSGAVFHHLGRLEATSPRPDNSALIPWTVKVEHQHAYPVTCLRLLGRRLRGEPISSPAKERMLDKWLQGLREADVVVCYHPDTPPNHASPKTGGWYYSRRRPGDGDSLFRYDPEAGAPQVRS